MKLRPSKLNPFRLAAAVGKRLFSSQDKPPAQPPGTLVHVGEQRVEELHISVAEYDEGDASFVETGNLEECLRFAGSEKVAWLHLTGLHDIEAIEKLGQAYDIHPLILEDILNTSARPKIEDFNDYVFVITKLMTFDEEEQSLDVQHFALLLLPDSTVLTFLEAPSAIFDPVRQRIKTGGGGRIRKAGADYLAWALMDSVIDNYFRVIDGIDESITEIDERLQEDDTSVDGSELYNVKREVTALHRLVRPIREIGTALHRSDSALMSEYSRPYYRDLYDHAVHVIEQTEDLRELAASLRDYYLSAVSNRMNEIMKVLTCFATIFLPLTFLAGIYGMNFEYIPELKYRWGYPALWVVFLITGAGMIWFFRRKKWL